VKRLTLAEGVHVHPTPAGAYHAVATTEATPVRQLLRNLLLHESSPPLTLSNLFDWSAVAEEDKALELLRHAQQVKWVQGLATPLQCPNWPFEQILPDLLAGLSNKGKALLADSEGFYLATSGFPHEVAEELSALGAELSILHDRRSGLLARNMGLNSSAWSIVDAAGVSKVGFWPLYVGKERFMLVVAGLPRFNQPDFTTLAWLLNRRYADAN
jgi:hypothetical protein